MCATPGSLILWHTNGPGWPQIGDFCWETRSWAMLLKVYQGLPRKIKTAETAE
jgi:hypothetical protein